MFLVVIYAPAIPIILYVCMVPESPRWLHAAGQHKEVLMTLDLQAAQNNRILSDKSIAFLSSPMHKGQPEMAAAANRMSITSIFRHQVLYLRLLACSIVWTLIVFIYYGISVKATKFDDDDNKVRNFKCLAFPYTNFTLHFIECHGNFSNFCEICGKFS